MTPDAAVSSQFEAWLDANWNPDMALLSWWRVLGDSGWAFPAWPSEWMGRGMPHSMTSVVRAVLAQRQVPGPPAGIGVMLAGPTILKCGTDDQKVRYLPPIVHGESMWCQLFSEPGAGSDLASLRTTARPVRGGWRVSGQKVWTSNGHLADMGMLLARTGGPSGTAGISWMAIEMDQPGIEVRPLREMTGRSLFNEVFLEDAFVSAGAVIGGVGGGWKAARVTLEHERGGLAEGSGAVGGIPGKRAGQLELSAAVIAARLGGAKRPPSGTAMAMRGRVFDVLLARARTLGMTDDPVVRQSLARLHTLESLNRYDAAVRGRAIGPGTPSLAKLRYTTLVRTGRDVIGALGPEGMLMNELTEYVLFAPAVAIYGGTDEIQKNIVAERHLGLPRDDNQAEATQR